MNFDYQKTQAEVTYQLVGTGDWAFKKLGMPGSVDSSTGSENALFDAHRTEMDNAGWSLVSMTAIPGTLMLSSASYAERSQTSNYDLFWKRIKSSSTESA
ncbi:hypothetical protein [Janthinobacterium sp. HH01]|uniref:hypothetical protein n=1 Tax=Janthinobacterium sp. HH01 TaxID=1198452 RepID=UPI001268FF22|nr:hypothetical protein [Janthinobacterium sp. HH01]